MKMTKATMSHSGTKAPGPAQVWGPGKGPAPLALAKGRLWHHVLMPLFTIRLLVFTNSKCPKSCNLHHYYYIRLTAFFSRTTQASRHQKGKPFWILLQQELDHVQIICTSLQTDNRASTSPFGFYRPDALPAAQPTASKH